MALSPCYECEKQISDLAEACPHCGAPSRAASHAETPESPRPNAPTPQPEAGGGALMGALLGIGAGAILMLKGFDLRLDSTEELTLLVLVASPFGIIGAVVGWALGK